MKTFDPQDVAALGAEILQAGPICDECLGRVASRLGTGLSNAVRGERIREALAAEGVLSKSGTCWVCGDLFERIESWARRSASMVSGREFATYLFGVKLTTRLEQMEAFYEERFPSRHRESLKHSLNRATGIAFERELSQPATVDFKAPQVSFVIDLSTDEISVQVLSLYLYGRYRKLERGIPQTKWPCRQCRGRGCEVCGFTGKQYPESVEEIIADPLIASVDAASACLHGAGREDIDARMLGSGRPFVLELRAPMRRSVDLSLADTWINERASGRVEVTPLKRVDRRAVPWVKELRATKTYRAEVAFSQPVDSEALQQALNALPGEIAQQTPQRVSHRRADLIRRRRVHEARGELTDATHGIVEVHGDGGLYIKELISGDNQRTNPSLSGRLGVPALVTALDVLDVCSGDVPESMEMKAGLA